MTRVLIIKAPGLSCLQRQRRDHFAQQLHGQFVEADDRQLFVIRLAVQMKEVFHPRQVLARYLADAPRPLAVRLEAVFSAPL